MGSILNLTKYPIDQPNSSQSIDFMQTAHDTFHRDGIVVVPGFMFPDIAAEIVEELLSEFDRNSMCEIDADHNIYEFTHPDPFYPATHPRNAEVHTKFHPLPIDDIPRSSILHRVYDWDVMTRFISALVNGQVSNPPLLHHFDDPLSSLSVNVLFDEDILNWHFDQAPFTAVILLQNAIEGGEYVVAPESLLVDGRYDYDLHGKVIYELENKTQSYTFNPGDLFIHRGSHSLHRLTTVFGDRPRMSAALQYARTPRERLSDLNRRSVYCRTEPLEYCQPEKMKEFTMMCTY